MPFHLIWMISMKHNFVNSSSCKLCITFFKFSDVTDQIRNAPDSLTIIIEFELKNFYNLKIKTDHPHFNKEKHPMTDNYEKIVQGNLLYEADADFPAAVT